VLERKRRGLLLPYRVIVPPTSDPVRFAVDPTPFRLDAELEVLTAARGTGEAPDAERHETGARLHAVRRSAAGTTLAVQPVSYAVSLRTNFALDAPLPAGGTLRERVHPGGRLGPVEASRLGDHLGVNALVLAADGALALRRRSARLAFRPGELAPSSSGAATLADAAAAADARDLLRETDEELGLGRGDVASVALLGVARELIRGGKPEIFLLVRTPLDHAAIAARAAGAGHRGEWEGPLLFADPGDPSLADPGMRPSAPLLAALALLHRGP
jgi:hypothetical protein